MGPLVCLSAATATYQRVSVLLQTLRHPAVGSGSTQRHGIYKTLSFSSLRKASTAPNGALSTPPTLESLRGETRKANMLHLTSELTTPGICWSLSFPALQKVSTALHRTVSAPCILGNIGAKDIRRMPMQDNARQLHHATAHCQREIPDYLEGNISQVDTAEDNLLGDDLMEDELCHDMEDDIIEFLTPRLIPHEEADTCFILPCPTCRGRGEEDTCMQEIFVDKNTGYFVCPWCCRDGDWEELQTLLNSREDCLTSAQLTAYLATTTPITPHTSLIHHSPLRVSKKTLEAFGARVTSDESRVILPVRDQNGNTVGIESVSLLHQLPQIIRRFIMGCSRAFSTPRISGRGQRVLVVPTCCDVLTLAEQGIHAMSLPGDDVGALESHLVETGAGEVLLWYRGLPPPRALLLSLVQAGVSCSLVKSDPKDNPIHLKTAREVQAALRHTIPVLSSATTTFHQLRDKVYHRVIHREETCGVQWKRFAGLNEMLLGHRPGELTVLTGPTGSGKTTFMAEYSLDLCCQGVRTLWGSFELSIVRLCEVLLQQYSGAPLPQNLHSFNTLATQFSTLPLHFLTYHGQQNVTAVIKAMTEAVQVWGVQHTIIDNLQFMLGCGEASSDRWWEQDQAVAALRRFSTLTGCHLTLIAHPKKVPEGQLLGIGSVFGSAKVTQEADNVFILQVKEGSTFANSRKVLQVVKNRYGGQLGDLPLRFHKDSLTLSSCFRQKTKERDAQRPSSLRKLKLKGLSAIDT